MNKKLVLQQLDIIVIIHFKYKIFYTDSKLLYICIDGANINNILLYKSELIASIITQQRHT